MKTGEEICQWLLRAPDARAEMAMARSLSDSELRTANGHLGAACDINTASGRLMGVCMVVSYERFQGAKPDKILG